MTKTKSTKRALLMSALALLMCVSMLIGSTFAWFTDSVSSTGNIIKTGTLDVDLLKGTKANGVWAWESVDGKAIFDYDKWEPGYISTAVLAVENQGSLHLKYKAMLTFAGTPSILADVIDIYATSYTLYNPDARPDFSDGTWQKIGSVADVVANGGLLMPEDDLTNYTRRPIYIALHMREEAGNEYQGLDLGGNFDITILATQYTSESDSFNNQYDKDAKYPNMVKNAAELVDALAAGGNFVLTNDVIISESLPVTKDTVLDLNGKNIGTDGTTTGSPLYLKGGKLTVKNGTLDLDGSHTNVNGTFSVAIGYDAQTELVVENVNFTGKTAINGTFATDGPLKITVSDCTMDVTSVGIAVSANSTDAVATITNCNIDADEYAIFASQGSKVTINGGTYKSAGKVITSMYDNTVVTINGGTFDGELWVTSGGSLVIYGGTFTADPTAYVADGYQAVNNGDGTWTVVVQ